MIASQFAFCSLRGTAFTRQGFTGSIPVLPTTSYVFQWFSDVPLLMGYDAKPSESTSHRYLPLVGGTIAPYLRGLHV